MLVLCAAAAAQTPPQAAPTQDPANNLPGHFDYFLLDMPWGPVFCSSIKDVSATCKPQPGFVVHGLWPQNNNGTWPQFCAQTPVPSTLRANLDITPDLGLLQHEWDKHGTCSGLDPQHFFAAEHAAFAQVQKPLAMIELTPIRTFTPLYVLNMFYIANPGFPPGSFSLSCKSGRVTAVEACFSKSLQPIRCQALKPCDEQVVTFDLPPNAAHP
jgi:ribonuclease T2